jgi:hypothetical protein
MQLSEFVTKFEKYFLIGFLPFYRDNYEECVVLRHWCMSSYDRRKRDIYQSDGELPKQP